MTDEAYWRTAKDPDGMLMLLGEVAIKRKSVMFACACCRIIWHLMTDERSRRVVEAAEQWAEGLVLAAQVHQLRRAAVPAELAPDVRPLLLGSARSSYWAAQAAVAVFDVNGAAAHAAWCARRANPGTREEARQADLLRDVFGNPFQVQDVAAAWLRWHGGLVPRMARDIHSGRRWGELPVLADALEEAGCADPEVLGHLRGPGPHVAGCWVLDLLTRGAS
jgi:hypothetical protein